MLCKLCSGSELCFAVVGHQIAWVGWRQVSAYDNASSYGSYTQPSSLKDYGQQAQVQQQQPQQQPAASKYTGGQAMTQQASHAAGHAAYSHAGSNSYGGAGGGASTSAPVGAAAAQTPQVTMLAATHSVAAPLRDHVHPVLPCLADFHL